MKAIKTLKFFFGGGGEWSETSRNSEILIIHVDTYYRHFKGTEWVCHSEILAIYSPVF